MSDVSGVEPKGLEDTAKTPENTHGSPTIDAPSDARRAVGTGDDPRLARIVEAWEELSEVVRDAIVDLATGGTP